MKIRVFEVFTLKLLLLYAGLCGVLPTLLVVAGLSWVHWDVPLAAHLVIWPTIVFFWGIVGRVFWLRAMKQELIDFYTLHGVAVSGSYCFQDNPEGPISDAIYAAIKCFSAQSYRIAPNKDWLLYQAQKQIVGYFNGMHIHLCSWRLKTLRPSGRVEEVRGYVQGKDIFVSWVSGDKDEDILRLIRHELGHAAREALRPATIADQHTIEESDHELFKQIGWE